MFFNNWTFENNDIATLETLKNLTTSTKIYANWNLVSYQLNYLNLMGSTHQNPIEYTIEDEKHHFEGTIAYHRLYV